MSLVFIDTETTALGSNGQIWEIAYAHEQGEVYSAFVPHTIVNADARSLDMNNYFKRQGWDRNKWDVRLEQAMFHALKGNTLVAANPHFDATKLEARWSVFDHWHHRMIDIESMAMFLWEDNVPKGLNLIREELVNRGYAIPLPDHTAAADVATLRASYYALMDELKPAKNNVVRFRPYSSANLDAQDRYRNVIDHWDLSHG